MWLVLPVWGSPIQERHQHRITKTAGVQRTGPTRRGGGMAFVQPREGTASVEPNSSLPGTYRWVTEKVEPGCRRRMGDNCSKLKQARFKPHISEKCFFSPWKGRHRTGCLERLCHIYPQRTEIHDWISQGTWSYSWPCFGQEVGLKTS